MKVTFTQACLTLYNAMDYSLVGSSVHGILQARMLKWAGIPFSRGSSQPRDQTWVSCTAGRFLTIWAARQVCLHSSSHSLLHQLWAEEKFSFCWVGGKEGCSHHVTQPNLVTNAIFCHWLWWRKVQYLLQNAKQNRQLLLKRPQLPTGFLSHSQ